MRDAVAKAIADCRGRLRMQERENTSVRAQLFAPPAVSDAEVGRVAEEVRRRWPGLTKVQAEMLRAEISRGARDDLLHALANDPLPTPVSEWASALWAQRIESTHRAEVATLDAQAEAISWALSAVAGIERTTIGAPVRAAATA